MLHIINYDLPNTTYGGIDEYIHRIGRTARIGNIGRATSFYNDRNEDIAEPLTKILLESKQVIPDFLQAYVPGDVENIDFGDNTDNEGEEGEQNGGGWGADGDANGDANGNANDNANGWGDGETAAGGGEWN